ncbi:MAG: hypothetical protein JXB13_14570, partial [Phycisphaerae bacterium]|nr:hypothetical protein [Phycisphaerae bacterium]
LSLDDELDRKHMTGERVAYALLKKALVWPPLPGDLDGDRDVDVDDYALLRSAFGRCEGDTAFVPEADYDGDGCVTLVDYQTWLGYYREHRNRAPLVRTANPAPTQEGLPRVMADVPRFVNEE